MSDRVQPFDYGAFLDHGRSRRVPSFEPFDFDTVLSCQWNPAPGTTADDLRQFLQPPASARVIEQNPDVAERTVPLYSVNREDKVWKAIIVAAPADSGHANFSSSGLGVPSRTDFMDAVVPTFVVGHAATHASEEQAAAAAAESTTMLQPYELKVVNDCLKRKLQKLLANSQTQIVIAVSGYTSDLYRDLKDAFFMQANVSVVRGKVLLRGEPSESDFKPQATTPTEILPPSAAPSAAPAPAPAPAAGPASEVPTPSAFAVEDHTMEDAPAAPPTRFHLQVCQINSVPNASAVRRLLADAQQYCMPYGHVLLVGRAKHAEITEEEPLLWMSDEELAGTGWTKTCTEGRVRSLRSEHRLHFLGFIDSPLDD